MSRHVIVPTLNSYDLIPIDQGLRKRTINIPSGLFVNMEIFNRVQEKDRLKRILLKLSRTGISRMDNGKVKDGQNCLDINFDGAVVSCCDGNFNKEYDDFYSILKFNGITF